MVVRVTSGAGTRERTAEQPIRVRVTDVNEPPAAPGAPTFFGETADSLSVAWVEPDNTGPPITGYDVQYREGGSSGFTDVPHTGTGRDGAAHGAARGNGLPGAGAGEERGRTGAIGRRRAKDGRSFR